MGEQAVIDYWSSVKGIIDNICEAYDGLWQRRNRILRPPVKEGPILGQVEISYVESFDFSMFL